MDRSMFAKPSSSRRGFFSNSNSSYELPRWKSPSPMAASMVPPPIVQSTYNSPPRAVLQSVLVEKPTELQDRQTELEADLQFLLDAQAEGLVKGLEGGLQDDQHSTGSTTPTAQSVRSASTRRATRPPRRKPGLRSARKGIYNAMISLSSLKDDELRDIDDEVSEQERNLEQIDEWESKRRGLREAAKAVDNNEDTIRTQRLRQEADALQEEINNVELQLADMKSRHRKLMRQAQAVENSVQAKLASYTSSLRLLDEDVQKFLSSKPQEENGQPASQDGKMSMWQLPPKRRTLDMAKQQWNEDRDAVLEQREGIKLEKKALDEGADVWKEVVARITDFERRLRAEMANLSTASRNDGSSSEDDGSGRLHELLTQMNELTSFIHSKFSFVKEQNWNLLIAAIGAELDALKQGRQLMESVLGISSPAGDPEDLIDTANNHAASKNDGEEIHELDRSFQTAMRRMSTGTDDDEPDPELLFSRHDTE